MKKDVARGSDERVPPPVRHNFFLAGIARIIQAMKPKRFISYRKKRINKDGSCVETEFIYRDDS